MRVRLRLLVAACAVGSVVAQPGLARADFAGHSGRIAFESGRTDELDIYSARPDGSDLRQLTSGIAEDHRPRWSADASRIVFFRTRGEGSGGNIFVMDADGSNLHRLTSGPADDEDPAWSPNGKRIALTAGPEGNADIFVMNADGSNAHRLAGGTSPGSDGSPSWQSL